ncbi:MAG: S1C family serine protease [Bacillota bacterium]
MSSDPGEEPRRHREFVLVGALALAAVAGAFASRLLFSAQPPSSQRPARPIVQIVRQQPGLPDLSDVVDRLCPSVAMIVPRGADASAPSSTAGTAAASLVSADGWLLVSSSALPQGQLDAVFGDGTRSSLSEMRQDPVSGLAIVKSGGAAGPPLTFNDQAFPRVGQFSVAVRTPVGDGCSASAAMIGSDFLADGGGSAGYIRLQPAPDPWTPGEPWFGADGRVIGIGADDPAGNVIPAPLVSVIVDELVRNSLSPATEFGFRPTDYPAPISTRLGNLRSGAGVALVQPKSAAARAGLKAGDIVTAVGRVPVSGASELGRALDAQQNAATLTVERDGQQLTVTVKREH